MTKSYLHREDMTNRPQADRDAAGEREAREDLRAMAKDFGFAWLIRELQYVLEYEIVEATGGRRHGVTGLRDLLPLVRAARTHARREDV